jgi:hypothetical protein
MILDFGVHFILRQKRQRELSTRGVFALFFNLRGSRVFYTLVWPRGGVNLPQHISGSKAPRNEIQMTTPVFSGSRNSMVLLVIMLYLKTESEKFKMAAVKTGRTCISASVQDSKEIPMLSACFRGRGTKWRFC